MLEDKQNALRIIWRDLLQDYTRMLQYEHEVLGIPYSEIPFDDRHLEIYLKMKRIDTELDELIKKEQNGK